MTIDGILIPKEIEKASAETVEMWVTREKIKQELEQHPERRMLITNEKGEDLYIDCKASITIIKKSIEKHCLPTENIEYVEVMIEKGKQKRIFLQKNYITKISHLSRMLSEAIGKDKQVNILDLKELDIVEMLGKFYTIEEVYKTIHEEWGYEVLMPQLMRWANKHKATIEQKKADYILRNKDFRIATDTGRLEVLNSQLSYWQNQFNKKHTESQTKLIMQILEQARREVKGNELHLTVDGKIDINASVHAANNIREVSRKLPINMLIIGMVAAKTGQNPLVLMTQLASSYYANANGFNGNITGNEEINSPVNLIKSYNWDELREKNRRHREQRNNIQDIVEIVDQEEKIQAKYSKDKLLQGLKKLDNKINK